jgi:hypothetical protein
MISASQIGQSAGMAGAAANRRATRKAARRSLVAKCAKQETEQSLIAKGAQVAVSTLAAAVLLVSPGEQIVSAVF